MIHDMHAILQPLCLHYIFIYVYSFCLLCAVLIVNNLQQILMKCDDEIGCF